MLFRARLFPFEQAILNAVGEALHPPMRRLYEAQVACINKVQRLLEWHEIEFYCMRFFRVRWPPEVLFENQAEFRLASGSLQARNLNAAFTVWSVGGHVFSIESVTPLKPLRSIRAGEIESLIVHSE